MSDPSFGLSDNPQAQRFELQIGGKVAGIAEYRPAGPAVMFTHTEIMEGHEGQGLGSRLVEYALGEVRKRGQQVVPMCPFVASYIREHREFVDLVQPGQRAVFGL
ncbi:GNAT family N-acetyltransferase [Deinococcus koreensis]|uniref:GNAT family N-acetyltransferase n=1 Tax=Deinococcus koreensis TaxID=2054903 RepID=A0A2K3V1C1_9DEIO|nr:GNAT family N-acetyltransferase [Deinococcus koreensis]PNY82579.1 GNAT family N-acetyltransferase [Deinococcus koreensis]